MRQIVFQMFNWLGALSRVPGTRQEIDELQIVVIFCGAGLDASLLCLSNGWL
jgi:hypothetical protein